MADNNQKTETIDVTLPSGEQVSLDVPVGSTPQEVAGFLAQISSGPRPQITQQAQPDSPQSVSGFGRFVRGATSSAQPLTDIAAGAKIFAGDPVGTTKLLATEIPKGFGRAQAEQASRFGKAVQEFKPFTEPGKAFSPTGTGTELLASGIAAVVPLAGPQLAVVSEQLAAGNFAEPLGLLMSLALPGALSKARGTKLGKAVQRKVGETSTTVLKVIKPQKNIRIKVKDSLPDVVEFLRESPVEIKSLKDFSDAISRERTAIGKKIDEVLGQSGDAIIDGNKLADAAINNFDDATKLLEPKKVKEITGTLDNFRIPFTIAGAESLRQGLNLRLGAFFRRNKISRKAAAADPTISHELALVAALEEEIEKALQGGGPKMAPIRKRYSSFRSVQDAVDNKLLDLLIKEDKDFLSLDSLDTIAAGSGVAALAIGETGVAKGAFLTVAARRAINLIEDKFRAPDARVTRTIRRLRAADKRKPGGLAQVVPETILLEFLLGSAEERKSIRKKKPGFPAGIP